MLHGDLTRFESETEAVAGRRGCEHHHGTLAVAAVERLHQVALFGLGRQTRRRAAALDVDHHQRQFGHDGQTERFAFERKSRAGGRRDGEIAGEGGADGRADAGDLVFGLHGLHAQLLVFGQLFENHRGRRDGVGAAEERQPRLFGGGHQSPCRGDVAVDRAVGALFERCGRYGIGVGELVGIGCEVVARVDSPFVGLGDERVFACEFRVEVLLGVVLRTVEEVETDAQREHVLALDHRLVVQFQLFERLAGHGRDAGHDEVVTVESQFRDRIVGRETGLAQIGFGERIAVDDDRRSRFEPTAVGFERRGIHRYQYVAVVAGVGDAPCAEMDLEARYSGHGSLRRTNLGGVVWKGRDAVAHERRGVGEKRPRELHSVARIAREADDDVLKLLYMLLIHRFIVK